MDKIGNIVYLSNEQYVELIDNGTLTVGDTTIKYSDNDIYITPDKGYTVVKVDGKEVNEWNADGKLDKQVYESGKQEVYVKNPDGSPGMVVISDTPATGAIPAYSENGLKTKSPVALDDCTNREYVDTNIDKYTKWYEVNYVNTWTNEEFSTIYDNVVNAGLRTSAIRAKSTGYYYQILGINGDGNGETIMYTNGQIVYKATRTNGVITITSTVINEAEGTDMSDYYDKSYIDTLEETLVKKEYVDTLEGTLVKHENGKIVTTSRFQNPIQYDGSGGAQLDDNSVFLHPGFGPVEGSFGLGDSQYMSNEGKTVPMIQYHDNQNGVHNYYEFPLNSGGTVALTSDVNAVSARVSSIEESVNTVSSRVDTNETNISTLEESVSSIEERLTKLGFKSGTVTVSRGTATVNDIARQGNYCILSLSLNSLTGVPVSSTNIVLGIVPDEFKPKETIAFYAAFTGIYNTSSTQGTVTMEISTSGEISIRKVNSSLGYVTNISMLNIGYEATSLL